MIEKFALSETPVCSSLYQIIAKASAITAPYQQFNQKSAELMTNIFWTHRTKSLPKVRTHTEVTLVPGLAWAIKFQEWMLNIEGTSKMLTPCTTLSTTPLRSQARKLHWTWCKWIRWSIPSLQGLASKRDRTPPITPIKRGCLCSFVSMLPPTGSCFCGFRNCKMRESRLGGTQ